MGHAWRVISSVKYLQCLDEFPWCSILGFERREPSEPHDGVPCKAAVDQSLLDPRDYIARDDLASGAFQHPIDYTFSVHDSFRYLRPP